MNKIFKKLAYAMLMLCIGASFTSCSDVEIPEGAYSEAISNLMAEVKEGTRQLTLSWTNPSMEGQSGIQVIQDNKDITNIDGVVSNYTIKKAPVNVDVQYTVKAMYSDGRISEGQTVYLNIPYEAKKASDFIAMVVPEDYTQSASETNAVNWFKANYVNQSKGVLLTPSTIDQLDAEKQTACWVMADRAGIAVGYANLPGNLASNDVIAALKAFATDGGNIFLSNHATQLVVAINRIGEAYAPALFGNGDGGDNGDIWGSQPIIGNVDGQIYDHSHHPIYNGMDFTSGLYARSIYKFVGAGKKMDHNCMWDLNAYGLSASPNVVKTWEDVTNSTVLGTWNHVVDYCCAGIVDFNPTTDFAGRVLCVGLAAYDWCQGDANTQKDQLETFTKSCLSYVSKASSKVAMLVPDDYSTSASEKNAVQWFNDNYVAAGTGVLLTPSTIDNLDIESMSECWVMCDRAGMAQGYENLPLATNTVISALKSFVTDGGNLLLTNHATQLAVAVGRIAEAYKPGLYGNGDGGDNGDIWGSQPIIGNADGQIYDHSKHAIYTGMEFTSGLYERSIYKFVGAGKKMDHNCMWDLNAYGLAANPNVVKTWEDTTNSTVLGTWNHVVDYCCAGIVDFNPTTDIKGRILCVGLAAYDWNQGDANTQKSQLEGFTANCINYMK